MQICINIYIRTTVATSCDLNAPTCTTEVLRVRLHGSQGGVFIGHRPPWDPGDPPRIYIYITSIRSLTSIQTVHTHPASGRVVRVIMRWKWGWVGDEKMRWKWRWDERYLTRTRRGERKRRRKEQTHTNTPGPERANPERQGKRKKRRVDGHGPRPAEGGKTEAPEPTWHSENLQTPKHATEPTYLGREESMR